MSRFGDLGRRMSWPQKLRMLPVALVYLVALAVWGITPGALFYTLLAGWSWDDPLTPWQWLVLAVSLLLNYVWGRVSSGWLVRGLDPVLDRAVDWAMRPR